MRLAHLFAVYGYHGAEKDLEKLVLTDHLLTAALCEAHVCSGGQLVIFVGS